MGKSTRKLKWQAKDRCNVHVAVRGNLLLSPWPIFGILRRLHERSHPGAVPGSYYRRLDDGDMSPLLATRLNFQEFSAPCLLCQGVAEPERIQRLPRDRTCDRNDMK